MNIEKEILKQIGINGEVATHHFGDMYEKFCELKNLDFNDIPENQRKLRYYLNKMVKKGILEKTTLGTGYCGGTDWCHTHFNVWHKPGKYTI